MTERAYDPEIAPFVPMLPTVADWSDMEAARAGLEEMIAAAAPAQSLDMGVDFEDRMIQGPADAPDLAVRIYRPREAHGTLPGVLYIHGGGFCVGSIQSEHIGAMEAASSAEALVVSVEYRLAPEHPFPAGIEDCYAALGWMAGEADALEARLWERLGVPGCEALAMDSPSPLRRRPDPETRGLDAGTIEALEALGYLEAERSEQ